MSIISGSLGAYATSHAADTTAAANRDNTQRTLDQQKALNDQEIAREKPFYDQGVTASANLNKMVNGGYNMQESPAAQYELQQGTKSLNRQLAARGLLGSGNASQRLAELSSGVAANDYNQQYSRLLDQVKIGTGASAAAGASSQAYGNQLSQANAQNIQSNNAVGQQRASLYSGMGGASASAASLGLQAYRSGLFTSGPETSMAAAPTTADAASDLEGISSSADLTL